MKVKLINQQLVLLLVLAGLVSSELSEETRNETSRTISAMFVMGDSTVDCGENTLFYSRLHRNLSLLPCSPSDHRSLLPNLLAEKMGVSPALPFYGQNGSIEVLTEGLNFGSAQATIMQPNSDGYQSMNQQLRQVSETVQLLHLRLQPKSLLHFVRSSLFFLSFGKDDFINNNNSNVSGLPRLLAEEMDRTLRSLHDLKIRRIVCAGIIPIGCAPRSRLLNDEAGSMNSSQCWEWRSSERVMEYNMMMEEKVMELNAIFPDARIVFCDVFQGIRDILSDPARYGISEVKKACCGMGKYGAEMGCVSEEMACQNREAHMWWDQYNPTKAVNLLLADSAWSGHLCRPITVQHLASPSVPRFHGPP